MNMLITHKGVGRHPPPAPKQRRPSSQAARRDKQVSIVFLDPRPLTRECFSRWLGASARDFRILPVSDPAEVPNGGGASADDADLILVNIGGADVTEAAVADTLALLHRDLPDTPVVVLADHEGVEPVVEAIRRGVRGYIPTSLPLSVAIEALRFVHAGGTFVPASVLAHSLEPERAAEAGLSQDVIQPDLSGLTGRELEVLERLCQGKPNKIIAFELDIRDATVKVHVRHIMKKLRVTNRTQVVCLARQLLEQRDAPAAEDRSLRARLADWRRP